MSLSVATPEAVTSSFTPTSSLSGLLDTYGDVMTPEQIAEALEYSVGYVRKKIGCAKFQPLPWVAAIAPHRRRQGLNWVYGTHGVASFLDSQRSSLESIRAPSKHLPKLLQAYGPSMPVAQVADALGYSVTYVSKNDRQCRLSAPAVGKRDRIAPTQARLALGVRDRRSRLVPGR